MSAPPDDGPRASHALEDVQSPGLAELAPSRLRLIAEGVGGSRLDTIPIFVRTPQGFLEPHQILLDAGARVLTEERGEHVGELAAPRAVLQRHPHERAPVGPRLET